MQVSSHRVYTGRVINLDVDTVRYPDGSTGELEMIRHPGAAAVIPFASDPAGPDPTILMLRQYRYATGGTLWEVPAGTPPPRGGAGGRARRGLGGGGGGGGGGARAPPPHLGSAPVHARTDQIGEDTALTPT